MENIDALPEKHPGASFATCLGEVLIQIALKSEITLHSGTSYPHKHLTREHKLFVLLFWVQQGFHPGNFPTRICEVRDQCFS